MEKLSAKPLECLWSEPLHITAEATGNLRSSRPHASSQERQTFTAAVTVHRDGGCVRKQGFVISCY